MVSFTNDKVFQPIHNNIGTPDRNAPAVVSIPRFGPVGNCGETPAGDGQGCSINRKSSDVSDLIKVPDDRSVPAHITVFVNDEDIRLWDSTVLIRPKTNVASYIGIGDSDKAGSGQGNVYLLLIPPKRRYPLRFEWLQAGTNQVNMCSVVLNIGVVNDKGSRTEIGVGLDNRRKVLSADIVGGPIRTLQGYQHILLRAGETKTVTFALTPENLAVYHPEHQMMVPEGKVMIAVGGGQPNEKALQEKSAVTAEALIRGEFTAKPTPGTIQ